MIAITCSFNFFRVGLGSDYIRELQYFVGTATIIHPDYDQRTLRNNIGFIVLQEPIYFTDSIQPIVLPSTEISLPHQFEQGVVTGFGLNNNNPSQYPQQLQRTFQRVLSGVECLQRFPHLTGTLFMHFCARDRIQQSNICGGDQGASFALLNRGKWTVVRL